MPEFKDLLNQLALMVKQCLKFLDALGFGLKHKIMFPIGECYQILWSVVILNAIKMMHDPAIRQGFIMSLFPYKYMFKHIIGFSSSGMVGGINIDISERGFNSTASPVVVFFAPCEQIKTRSTTLCCGGTRFPTVNAGVVVYFIPYCRRFLSASGAKLKVTTANLKRCIAKLAYLISHNLIIPHGEHYVTTLSRFN